MLNTEGTVASLKATRRNPNRTSRAALVLAIAMLVAMGCAAQQPPVVARDDGAITNDVQARLAADTQVNEFKIAVETKAAVVQLTGLVPTDGDRDSIERIARETPGVRAVDNDVMFGN